MKVRFRYRLLHGTTEAIGVARAPQFVRSSLLLMARSRDGLLGIGECSPLPGYSRESLEDCSAALHLLCAQEWDVSESAPWERIEEFAGRLAALPSALFAVETAVLDLVSRAQGLPLWSMYGTTQREQIVCSALVSLGDERSLVETQAVGYRRFKLKIQEKTLSPTELMFVGKQCLHLRGDSKLRLDPNGGWVDPRGALERLKELPIEYVEEPVSGERLFSLGAVDVPWAVDESLVTGIEPERFLEQPGCVALVLKPALLGGWRRVVAIANIAREFGRAVVLTHLFDGPIGLLAARAMAFAIPGTLWACGLDRHKGLEAFVSLGVSVAGGPRIDRPLGAGMGVIWEELAWTH